MADAAAFPYLGSQALDALGLLGSPIYIYSFVTQRICWANRRAGQFWNASSVVELYDRDLGPVSISTATRLADYRDVFRRGDDRTESWTFYPKGEAISALCRCSGVRIDGHDEAMLVEIQTLKPVELPESELRSLEALRHTPLMISLFTPAGEVLMRNPAALAKFGEFDRALPPGTDHFRAMFARAEDCERLLADAAETRRAHRSAAIAVRRWPVHAIQLSLVTDPATGREAMLVAQQDISQLIDVSRQLAASEEALDSVLSLNVAPTLVLSAQGAGMLKANFAAQALLGAGSAEGQDAGHFFADPARFEYLRGAVLAAGSGTAVMNLRSERGTTFWCSVAGARIRYEGQDALVLLITNVDQLYQTAAELETALEVERRAGDMQRRYLAIAAHEFRTPLAVIDSNAQQLERKAEVMEAEQVRARAARIRGTARRLVRLFDETIERAARNMGSMGYFPERARLAPVIEGVVSHFRESQPAARIDLDLPDLPDLPELALDTALMEQAFANLIGNAIKYSDGVPRIAIRAAAGIEHVEVRLRDWGIGIARGEWDKVFGEHARGSNVGERPGTGLGLSIVRQIVELHGGMIEIIETPNGPGTTMRMVLPRP